MSAKREYIELKESAKEQEFRVRDALRRLSEKDQRDEGARILPLLMYGIISNAELMSAEKPEEKEKINLPWGIPSPKRVLEIREGIQKLLHKYEEDGISLELDDLTLAASEGWFSEYLDKELATDETERSAAA